MVQETLPPAPLSGESFTLDGSHGPIAVYASIPAESTDPPLVLVHSVNAAASAYEVKTLYDHYGSRRPTYALDLPGYGRSDRRERRYTPRLMTDAIGTLVAEVQRRHDGAALDALALSLACEFLARLASEDPRPFRSLALVSPTAMDGQRRLGAPGSTRGNPLVRSILTWSVWDDALFRNLTRPSVIRFFLEKTWGSKDIDEGMWAYDVKTTRAPGAKHAPLCFLSGELFSADATRLYESLEVPVWVAHGVRGDFTDYSGADRLVQEHGYQRAIFDTGALPHFEVLDEVVASYDAFLAKV